MRKKSFRNKRRTKRIHKYVKIGSNKTRCGKKIQGTRKGTGGSLKWTVVTCPKCLEKKDTSSKVKVRGIHVKDYDINDKPIEIKIPKRYEDMLIDQHNHDNDDDEKRAVILVGDPISGMSIIGSFNNMQEAVDWAYHNLKGQYVVSPIHSVGQWEHL
jgi:hypothetical protein